MGESFGEGLKFSIRVRMRALVNSVRIGWVSPPTPGAPLPPQSPPPIAWTVHEGVKRKRDEDAKKRDEDAKKRKKREENGEDSPIEDLIT